jgi:hypothetical protein
MTATSFRRRAGPSRKRQRVSIRIQHRGNKAEQNAADLTRASAFGTGCKVFPTRETISYAAIQGQDDCVNILRVLPFQVSGSKWRQSTAGGSIVLSSPNICGCRSSNSCVGVTSGMQTSSCFCASVLIIHYLCALIAFVIVHWSAQSGYLYSGLHRLFWDIDICNMVMS